VKQVERSIYGLDVFQVVTVTPDEAIKSDGTLPLKVEARERKTQSIKVGVGLGIENNRWEQHVTSIYTHRNLFGHLTRLDMRVVAGYAELPHPFRPVAHGPVVKVGPKLRKKGLLERRLVWTLEPGFELGINEGYQFWSPTNRIGVSRFFFRFLELGVSHNLRYVNFFNLLEGFNSQASLLGLDFKDPYLLSYLQFVQKFYFTDQIVNPDNGAILGVTYDLAGLGGDYDYHKVTPSLRAYWRIIEHIQLAGRVEVGFIRPYGAKPGAPFDLKYYLGGTNSVRGWGFRRLSPKVDIADEKGVLRSVPVGGNTMFTASLEARFKVVGPLHLVGFYDIGDVREQLSEFVPREWNHAVGPGLRLHTPIGVFRIDAGIRIGDTPLSLAESRWAFHFGLGEAF
ncbi:MAG: BamA/TamA family outer membrane protein, partial [Nannocystaceae bacterium]